MTKSCTPWISLDASWKSCDGWGKSCPRMFASMSCRTSSPRRRARATTRPWSSATAKRQGKPCTRLCINLCITRCINPCNRCIKSPKATKGDPVCLKEPRGVSQTRRLWLHGDWWEPVIAMPTSMHWRDFVKGIPWMTALLIFWNVHQLLFNSRFWNISILKEKTKRTILPWSSPLPRNVVKENRQTLRRRGPVCSELE